MKELREIQKAINLFDILLSQDRQQIKKNSGVYLDTIEQISKFLQELINSTSEIFIIWSAVNVQVFFEPSSNIFAKIKRSFKLFIIDKYLRMYAVRLEQGKKLKERAKKIEKRITQIKYFC